LAAVKHKRRLVGEAARIGFDGADEVGLHGFIGGFQSFQTFQ
jgi:hypothetical protein